MRRAATLVAVLLLGFQPLAVAQEATPPETPPPQVTSPEPARPEPETVEFRTFQAERVDAEPAAVPGPVPEPPPSRGPRLVLLPFENLPRASAARPAIMKAVEAVLTGWNYQVVTGEPVEEFLRARRIRYLDSITSAQAADLLRSLDADALMVGSILSWGGTGQDPVVALTMRVHGPSGEVRWSDLGGLTASQSEGAFGLGKVTQPEALAARLVTRLLAPLHQLPLSQLTQRRPLGGSGPRVFRSRDLPPFPLKMGVLPLENLSGNRDAPRILDVVLQQRLSERTRLAPVSPSELRAAVVEAHLWSPAQMSPEQLRQLGQAIGTPLFLRGLILGYGPAEDELTGDWAVELYLTLVDVESGRTLWSGLHRRTGLHYQGLLKFGAERSDVVLAGRVVGEMLEAFTRP